jgi:hypothetical protein
VFAAWAALRLCVKSAVRLKIFAEREYDKNILRFMILTASRDVTRWALGTILS